MYNRNINLLRVSHSISGCVEAPIQLVMTSFLVMKGILGIPWWKSPTSHTFQDTAGNEVNFYSIPLWTLIFSIIDILKCTVLANIFNVYIGKISSWGIFKKYVNLICGQLPFFFHAIIFRVLAYSFLVTFLNEIAVVPIFMIWISNLVIGYAVASNKQAHKDLKKIKNKLTKMKSMARRDADLPKVEKGSTKSKAMIQSSTPIWLNSFFSIMVPTCSLDLIDPDLVHRNKDNEQLQRQFCDFNKKYQKRAMTKLLISSSFIILVSVGVICAMVNFSRWRYNANIYGNLEFNILCLVLFIMGLISLVFMKSTDVYELFRLNSGGEDGNARGDIEMTEENVEDPGGARKQKTNKCKVLIKMLVTVTCLVIVMG